MNVPVLFPQVFDLHEVALLLVIGDRAYTMPGNHLYRNNLPRLRVDPQLHALVLLVGVFPLGGSGVVEFPAAGADPEKQASLFPRWIQSILTCSASHAFVPQCTA